MWGDGGGGYRGLPRPATIEGRNGWNSMHGFGLWFDWAFMREEVYGQVFVYRSSGATSVQGGMGIA
jgi:hypothetical protein